MDQHIENLNQNPQPKKRNEDDSIGHERGIFFSNETGMA
jgi:hypothetical protein